MRDRDNTNNDNVAKKRIAYIIGTYPDLTTTFIDREILEAQRLGLNMVLVAIRKSKRQGFRPAIQQLMQSVIYLLPVSVTRLVAAHLYYMLTSFRAYTGTLIYLLTRKHPDLKARAKTLLHFGEGILAAWLLRDKKIDHVHAHFADRAAVIAMIVSRMLGIPYSLTAHANDIYVAPVLMREKIGNAKFATTCTAFNKAHIEKETGQKIELIYHGLEFAEVEPTTRSAEAPEEPLILSVGQLKEKKGFPFLIDACAILRDKGYRFRCEIVGDGPDREKLSDLIRDRKLGETITLCGALPNAEVMHKYSRAYVFALASIVAGDADRDGIPNVILEAMAHRLPIVSTKVSGIPEVVHDRSTGILVESRNAEQLASAIAYLLDNPIDAEVMGRTGAEFVSSDFDIRRNVGRLLELFTT